MQRLFLLAFTLFSLSIPTTGHCQQKSVDGPTAEQLVNSIITQTNAESRAKRFSAIRLNRDLRLAVHLKLIQHPDDQIRAQAIESIGLMRRRAEPAIEQVGNLLETETAPELRHKVIVAIGRIARYATPDAQHKLRSTCCQRLVDLASSESELALIAAGTVVMIEEEVFNPTYAPQILPLLVETAINGKDEESQIEALGYIGKLNRNAEQHTALFFPLLDDNSVMIRCHAAETINSISATPSPETVDAFLEVLYDQERPGNSNDQYRPRSVSTIAQLYLFNAHAAAAPGLIQKLDEPDEFIRFNAARILADSDLEKHKHHVVPVFLEMLLSEDPARRAHSATILGKSGEDTDQVVNALIELLDDKGVSFARSKPEELDYCVYESAAAALGKLGLGARTAAPRIIELIEHPHEHSPSKSRKLYDALLMIDPGTTFTDESFEFEEVFEFTQSVIADRLFYHFSNTKSDGTVLNLTFHQCQADVPNGKTFELTADEVHRVMEANQVSKETKFKRIWTFKQHGADILWEETRLDHAGTKLHTREGIARITGRRMVLEGSENEFKKATKGEWVSSAWDAYRKTGGSQGFFYYKEIKQYKLWRSDR